VQLRQRSTGTGLYGSGTYGSGTYGSPGIDVEDQLNGIREEFDLRRDLTGSEEALLAVVVMALHAMLLNGYGVTATQAAPIVVIVYLALRCRDRPFL